MNQSRSEINRQQIEWRQSQVLTLSADGYSEREIAAQLRISQPTIHRDIALLKQQTKQQINEYITHRVPYEYKKTLAGLDGIIKLMSQIITESTDSKEIMQASSIKMQALNMKMEMVSGSLQKLKVKPRPVKGAVSNLRVANQEVMIDFIEKDRGLELERDTYEKYDLELGEDERMKMQGFHIISSEIELTDSSGMNKTIVRR